jgi:hypothetical protein
MVGDIKLAVAVNLRAACEKNSNFEMVRVAIPTFKRPLNIPTP